MQIRGLHLSSRCFVILIITFIRFHDVLAGDCGGVLTDQAGNILTPNYPDNYPNNVDCHWTIVVATGQVISLKLTTFNVGFSDRVSVYDGDSTQSSLLGTYNGFWDEEPTEQFLLRSRGPSLHVYFRSGSGVTGAGFAASYWAHECRPFTYGRSGCTEQCQCVQNNTDFCRSLTGECVCKAGWEQSTCSTQHVNYQPADVDECRDPNICPGDFSTCINKPGSYECACKPGLKKTGQMCYDTCTRKEKRCSGICGVTSLSPYTEQCYCPNGKYLNYTDGQTCIECSDWTYGEDCKHTSRCRPQNTKSLNKTNGYCTCDIHWESTNCDVDFNECNGAHPCNQTSSFCRNTQGAFECACLPGFYTLNSTDCQVCDNIIKNASGSIESYFYRGSAYSQLCAWTIVVPEGLVVDLKFQHFSMGGSAHLDIYDGGNTSATLIGRYYYQPSVVRTTGNTMHIVRLETSPFYLGYGFTASFTSFECPPFTYGERCQTSCNCVQNHTAYCNNMNGQCVCKPQWTSRDCSLYKNECADNPLACPDYSDCIYNGNGTFYCQCFDGLVLAASGTCVIKNSETACTNRNCSHMCVLLQQLDKTNKVTCYCPIGMLLQGNNCQTCVNLTYANHCSRHCQCDAEHTASCDTRVGWCSCKQGWTSRDCSQDINECYTGQNICQQYARCVNTPGDYTCTCPHENGLVSVGEKICEDIKCSYTFSNTTGVIQSPDYPQYYYNRAHCTWDITAESNHIISVNFSEFSIQNHYSCAYDAVSFYDGNNTSRKLIGTYCGQSIPKIVRSTGNNMHIVFTSDTSVTGVFYGTYVSHSCGHFKFGPTCAEYCHCAEANTLYCDNILGKCICGRGWMGDTCHDDVNECLGTNNKLCPDNSVCNNRRGSYSCQCNLGYFLNTSTGQCDGLSAVDKCRLCQHQCIFNKLNNSVSCQCHNGFKVDPTDELKCSDCENGTFGHNCSQNCSCVTSNTAYCNKVNGSCVCKQGWTGDRCQTDVDECGDKIFDCPENSNCVNTNGSYDCDCIDGFKKTILNKTLCIECENGTFGHNCSQNCSCVTSNTAYCNKVNGSCVCKQGWTGDTCQLDINECTVNNTCQFKDKCSNFDGGYNCSCPVGFYLLIDGHTCHECEHFKYGRDCEETCSCIRPYSLGCNPVDGACDCVAGRQGDNCADDINECENSSLCMQELNFDCVNTIGSYRCICKPGFYLKNIFQQEVCKECLENFYGENCTKACTCASNAVCDKADGSCFCGAGWRGENCDVDVDECSEGLHQCDASKHLICVNTKGNSTCECQSGYAWFPESNDCIVPYFPFGAESNDVLLHFSNSNKLLSNENVFVSQPISLSSGVAFGNSYPITAQILTSGAIVFDDGNDQVTGTPDLKFAFLQRDKIVAPYWSDIDPNSGQVFYHLYERCGSSVFMGKPDATPSQLVSSVMRRAEADIAKFHHLSGFTANVVLVATWVSVSPLSDANVTDKEHNNTFQAVFVSGWKTDTLYEQSLAETSYVIYIYQKPKMKWRYVRGRIIQIGFTNGQELKALPNTNSRVVTLLGNYKWNTDYEGVVSYETGSVSSPAQSCHRYICDNVGLLQDPVYQKDKKALYQCPCSIDKLGHQWLYVESRGTNKDIKCYAISYAAKNRFLPGNKRNKLCCYKTLTPTCSNDWQTAEELKQQSSYVLASPDSGHVLITDPFNNREALANMEAHKICCANSSQSLCEKFDMIFPEMGCSPIAIFLSASAFGDPHIKTLDGVTYTMNGWGEYTLMEVKSENFTLQARTHRAENVKGQEVNGTVFSALAAKEWDNASLQVELASTNTSMIIYINDIDFTNDFYNNPEFSVNLETISAVQECISNKTLLIVAFPCGVTIKVGVSLKSLEVELDVDQYIRNKTTGLFGNFNGDITDEFVLPNGTMLPANITEQQIFYQFAKYWEVTIENSIFTYKNYESAVDYQHPEFVPLFLDDVDNVVKINASRICGDNTFCSYDFIALQDPTFALNTKSTSLAHDARRQDLENSSPTINVNNRNQTWNGFLMITSGQEASLSVLTGDTNGDGVTLETVGNTSGVRIEKNTIIVYNNILNLSKLGFRARDSHGAYSSIMYITIATCSGCSGHGVCDPENMKHQQTSDFYFEKMACTCDPAYTGPNCENELDACDIKPCSPGQSCTDLTAAQQGQNNTGFICGPCPPGFRDFHGKCVDVDECESVPDICHQVCTNTEGSYLCSCKDGYRQGNGSTLCKDIDECVEHTSSCSQLCINKDGNYSCGCLDGYTLQEDQFSCFLEPDLMDLCKECEQLCNVDNTKFEVHCGCNIGYFMDSSDGFSCEDINECAEGNISCTQECANTEGSFICSCRQGYQLASDGISCSPCEIPAYGMNCSATCDCKGQGSCDPVEGCVCDKNWSGESCDVDVNECDQENVCPTGQLCRNTLGSFDCLCPSGYEKKGDDCLDINECKRLFTNITCDLQVEYCYNTPGSYICRCRPGFSHNNVSVCEDIDECKLRKDGCSQICKNVEGKYNCECFDGYILAANRHDCVLFSDVCTGSKFNCTSICSTTDVAIPNCVCPRGYQKLDFNGTEYCKDIDECADEEMNLCSVLDRCVNVDGNFNCSCPPGYSLDNDGRSCIECTGKTWGPQCSNDCECGVGADHCDTVTGCVCKPGYTGKRCETDIDECSAGFITCRERELCVNTQGSANCRCNNVTENRICVASRACVNRSMNCSFSCARIGDVDSCICPAGQNVASDSVTCVECEDGTYGVNCGMQCSCNRTNTEKCDVITGLCSCKPEWSGEKCHIYSVDRNNKACEIKQKIAPCTEPEICEEIKGIAVCRAPSQEQHVMTLIIALCLSVPTFVLIAVAIGVLVWCWVKQKHKVQDSKQMTELRTYDHLGPSIQEPEYSEGETQVMEIYDEIDDLSVGFGNDETSDNYRNIEYSEYTDPDGQEHDQQESDSD